MLILNADKVFCYISMIFNLITAPTGLQNLNFVMHTCIHVCVYEYIYIYIKIDRCIDIDVFLTTII